MKPDAVLELLEATAQQLEIRISYEPLQTSGVKAWHGGLCRVKGEYRIIVDKRATTEERVTTLATALARLDTGGLEMPDKIRELIRLHEPSSKHRLTAA